MELNDLIGALEAEGWHKQPSIDDLRTSLARLVGGQRQYIDLHTFVADGVAALTVGAGDANGGNMILPRYSVIHVRDVAQAIRIIWAVTGSLEKLIQTEVCRQVATAEHALYRRP